MRKIPTLFVRDFTSRPAYVTEQVTPGCEWVPAGEGVATRKYDGTCVKLDASGDWLARREVKEGKVAPAGFIAVAFDATTGKTVGWEPIEQSSFAKAHADALSFFEPKEPGTYELCGPKIDGNPEQFDTHVLVPHAHTEIFASAPRTFDGLRAWLGRHDYEGIVFHHPDGRMAKIKRKDFKP